MEAGHERGEVLVLPLHPGGPQNRSLKQSRRVRHRSERDVLVESMSASKNKQSECDGHFPFVASLAPTHNPPGFGLELRRASENKKLQIV